MTVDRGGIDYNILVKDSFSSNLQNFKSEVREAKAEWASFRAELNSRGATSNRARREARDASRQAKKDLREQAKNFNARAKGIEKVNRETRKQAVNQAAAETTNKRQFSNEKRLLTATEQRQAAEKRLTSLLNKRRQLQANLNAVQARGLQITEQEALTLKLASKVRIGAAKKLTELEREKLALQKATSRANDRELSQITAQTAALKIKAAAQKRAAVEGILRSQGLDGRGNALAPNATTSQFNSLRSSIDKADSSANRISFTFRRLFGILAAFTAARVGLQGFRSLVSQTIRLNAELEQSVLGVAGLLTALGQVNDANGQITDGARALVAAQGEARRQLELLRGDALKTSASFQELADTFQVALAPGFQAGLDLDEIRRLTVRISQAAGAIGLPQNQLPEEIRSLLSGTITPRTTRIATALGITNEDIRNAKEAGELVEFLDQRFAAFAVAGDAALKNFSTILINLKDGLSQILRLGGFDFFVALKQELAEILETIATLDGAGNIVFNEDAVAVVKEITDGLKAAVEEAAGVGEALDFDDLKGIGTLIGKSIAGAAKTAKPLVSIILQVVAGLGKAVDFLSGFNFLGPAFIDFLVTFISISAAAKILLLTIGSISKVWTALNFKAAILNARLAAAGAGATRFGIAMAGARAAVLPLSLGIAAAVFAFSALSAEARDINDRVNDLSDALGRMPVSVRETSGELQGQKELMKEIKEEALAAADAFEITVGTAGLQGVVREQAEATIKVRQKFRDLQKQQGSETESLEKALLDVAQERIEAEQTIQEFISRNDAVTARTFAKVEAAETKLIKLNAQRADQEAEILRLQGDQTDGANIRRNVLKLVNRNLDESIRLTKQQVITDLSEGFLDDFLEVDDGDIINRAVQIGKGLGQGLDFDGIAQEAAVKLEKEISALIEGRQKAEADTVAIQETQNNLTRQKNLLISQQSTLLAAQIRASAEASFGTITSRGPDQAIPGTDIVVPGEVQGTLNEDIRLDAIRLANAARLKRAYEQLGNTQRAGAQSALDLATEELKILREKIRIEEEAIDGPNGTLTENRKRQAIVDAELDAATTERNIAETSEARKSALGETINQLTKERAFLFDTEAALKRQLAIIETRNDLLAGEATKKKDDAQDDVDRTTDTFANAVEGFREGMRKAKEETKNAFDIASAVTFSAVQKLSALIADTIVDAFDPTSDKTIEQRIGSFFQSIARQLLELTAQALIFRAILGLGGGDTPNAFGRLLGLGAATGGFITPNGARGYAAGGSIRPAGLPASDTVPIWATPGEYMVKKSAVSTYGADTMQAINRMLVDPGELRSLAGLTGRRRASRRRSSAGFAVGGTIPSDTGQGDSGPQMPVVVPLPADNATMEALLNGGQGAYFSFVQSNQKRFKGALGIS